MGIQRGPWGLRGDSRGLWGLKSQIAPWESRSMGSKGGEMAPPWGRDGCGLGGWFQGAETKSRWAQGKVGPPSSAAEPRLPRQGLQSLAVPLPAVAIAWDGG